MEMKGEEEKSIQLNKILEQQSSQIQEMQEELVDLRRQLPCWEKFSNFGLLSAGIVHEIKNPLNFINNFSELGIEYFQEIKEQLTSIQGQENTKEIRDLIGNIALHLNKIQQNGGRINRIVTSILLHSREGSDQFELNDLHQLIKDFVNVFLLGMRVGKELIHVDIQLDLNDTLPLVPLKAEDFSRGILNLCNNAFDPLKEKKNKNLYGKNPEDSQKVGSRPIIISYLKEEEVNLEIKDNSQGVFKACREKIFESFFTAKKRLEGKGLGLCITRGIIKVHRGRLTHEAEEKLFNRFIVKIPTHIHA